MPILMTPHYKQLFASQQSDLRVTGLSLNRDLARIQECCNHWCMVLNPNKTMALGVSRSRTVNPLNGDLVLAGVSICVSPKIDILGVKFDRRLTFEDDVRGIVSRVSQRIGIFRLVNRVFVDTSVLLRCYYACVALSLEYCSPVCASAAECHLQLLGRQAYSVDRLCPDQTFLSLCHRRHVAALCMLYKVKSLLDLTNNESLFVQ